jgi:hypothetical protein
VYNDADHPVPLRSYKHLKLVDLKPIDDVDVDEPVSAYTRNHAGKPHQAAKRNRGEASSAVAAAPVRGSARAPAAAGTARDDRGDDDSDLMRTQGADRQARGPAGDVHNHFPDYDDDDSSESPSDDEGDDIPRGNGGPRRRSRTPQEDEAPARPIIVHSSDERKADRNRFLHEVEKGGYLHAALRRNNVIDQSEITVMITTGTAPHAVRVFYKPIDPEPEAERRRAAQKDIKGEDLYRLINEIEIRYPVYLHFKDESKPFYPWERAAIHFLSPLTCIAAYATDESPRAAKLCLLKAFAKYQSGARKAFWKNGNRSQQQRGPNTRAAPRTEHRPQENRQYQDGWSDQRPNFYGQYAQGSGTTKDSRSQQGWNGQRRN